MKLQSFLLIFMLITASVYTVYDSTVKYIDYVIPSFTVSAQDTVTQEKAPNKSEAEIQQTPPSDTEKAETTTNTAPALPVLAEGTAVGKIISEFLAPYNAGTAYSKVYVKNNSGANINIESLLNSKCSFSIEENSTPQVLIMHTHTTESYIMHESDYYTENDQPRTTDDTKNMIAIGNIFEKKLTEAGIGVIHDTTIHDHPSYTGSYSRSAKTITSDLAAYPSVKVVIDIHRDAISRDTDKIKPIAKINGKTAAQVMLVMGSETGSVTGHANWQENLKLAVKYQEKMEEMYPGLARALMLNSSKYNQHLTKGSILLEVGSDANTLSEAKLGAELAAEALVATLMQLD